MPIILSPQRTGTISVRGDEMTVWLNPPISIIAELTASNERMIEGLRAIVVNHDVRAEEGGPRVDVGKWDEQLVTDVVKAWREAVKSLPPASSATSR